MFCPVNVTGLKLYDQDLSTTEPGERTLKEKEKEKEKKRKKERKKSATLGDSLYSTANSFNFTVSVTIR